MIWENENVLPEQLRNLKFKNANEEQQLAISKIKAYIAEATAENDIVSKQLQLDKARAEIDKLRADEKFAKQNTKNLEALEKTENELRDAKKENLEWDSAQKRADIWYKNQLSETESNKRNLIDANTDEARKRISEIDKRIEHMAKSIEYTDAEIEYLQHLAHLNWAKYGLDFSRTVSQEARSWITFGLSDLGGKSGSSLVGSDGYIIDKNRGGSLHKWNK